MLVTDEIKALANGADVRPIADAPGYFITDRGDVIYTRWGRAIRKRPTRKSDGYMGVNVVRADGTRKLVFVHALVLAAFHEPRPNGLEARHLDGDQVNNAASNLTWGTRRENAADRLRHRGSHRTKLADADVALMRRLYADGASFTELATRFGISHGYACDIVQRKRWRTNH